MKKDNILINTRHSKKQLYLGDNASSIIELLKWVGIVAMTFDHIGILISGDNDIFRMVGRLAFPIFGFVLVYNFIYHTKNKVKYIKRIALFSLFLEPIHFLVFKNHYAGMNIFFIYMLALSFLYLYELVQDDKEKDKMKVLFLIIFLVLSIYVSQYTEYHMSGVLLIISFYFTLKDKRLISATLLFLIVLNAPAIKYIISTLLIVPIGYFISKININVPRSRYFFYLYYPAHILVLGAYAFYW